MNVVRKSANCPELGNPVSGGKRKPMAERALGEKTISKLNQLLLSENYGALAKKMERPAALRHIAAMLGNENDRARKRASDAMIRAMRDGVEIERAFPVFGELLGHHDAAVRQDTAQLLAFISWSKDISPLIGPLWDMRFEYGGGVLESNWQHNALAHAWVFGGGKNELLPKLKEALVEWDYDENISSLAIITIAAEKGADITDMVPTLARKLELLVSELSKPKRVLGIETNISSKAAYAMAVAAAKGQDITFAYPVLRKAVGIELDCARNGLGMLNESVFALAISAREQDAKRAAVSVSVREFFEPKRDAFGDMRITALRIAAHMSRQVREPMAEIAMGIAHSEKMAAQATANSPEYANAVVRMGELLSKIKKARKT